MFAILAVILPFWSRHAIFNGGLGQKKQFQRKTSGLGKKVTKKYPGCKSADNIWREYRVLD
jgi:hypothetical protein